ncbi:peptidase [Rhodoferax sp. U2-2l]|uniref:PepSY domain-containing protein n=1 Tax=Rhodoferax sp. U2-2l TaxID=2884000 RepID=UPI001D0A8864|nr:PepSY domain-containing protein [Rhodoferax sp. U2-2l]MCB8748095.1 peptidase [Rhodoferax sp. U2-2l]
MKFLTALTTALLMTLTLPAWADVSRDDAAATAQRSSGGRVLAVDRAEQGGRAVWRVKVLTPRGEVRVILVDVASGRTM